MKAKILTLFLFMFIGTALIVCQSPNQLQWKKQYNVVEGTGAVTGTILNAGIATEHLYIWNQSDSNQNAPVKLKSDSSFFIYYLQPGFYVFGARLEKSDTLISQIYVKADSITVLDTLSLYGYSRDDFEQMPAPPMLPPEYMVELLEQSTNMQDKMDVNNTNQNYLPLTIDNFKELQHD